MKYAIKKYVDPYDINGIEDPEVREFVESIMEYKELYCFRIADENVDNFYTYHINGVISLWKPYKLYHIDGKVFVQFIEYKTAETCSIFVQDIPDRVFIDENFTTKSSQYTLSYHE